MIARATAFVFLAMLAAAGMGQEPTAVIEESAARHLANLMYADDADEIRKLFENKGLADADVESLTNQVLDGISLCLTRSLIESGDPVSSMLYEALGEGRTIEEIDAEIGQIVFDNMKAWTRRTKDPAVESCGYAVMQEAGIQPD